MLSATPVVPLPASQPVVYQASPPAMPPAAVLSGVVEQEIRLVTIAEKDARAVIGQEFAQMVSFDRWRWETLLGMEPVAPSQPSVAAVQQPSRGEGKGSGAATTAYNAPNPPIKDTVQKSGRGVGTGANTNVHEAGSTRTVGGNTSKHGIEPLVGSGSGSNGGGGGGGIGSAKVNGWVWLDNNGDGNVDNGETGYTEVEVNLETPSGQVVMSTWTDANGNYQFNPVDINQSTQFKIQVIFPPDCTATWEGPSSDIDGNGYTLPFTLAPGQAFNAGPAGIRSTNVTTIQDNPNGVTAIADQVTLRDAINTVVNGLNQPVTFKAGLSGAISLQAALPILSTTITIDGPGSTNITVKGNGNAGNPYRIFTVNAGVIAEIDGLKIQGGFMQNDTGGGILNNGDLTLKNDDVTENQAAGSSGLGGGVYNGNIDAGLTLEATEVDFNTAGGAGGGIYNFGGGVGINSGANIYLNKASSGGGGIFNTDGGVIRVTGNSQIARNSVTNFFGGGVYNMDGMFSMVGGAISENKEKWGGGGGVVNSGTMTLTSVAIQDNGAKTQGGGHYVGGGELTLNSDTLGGPPGLNNTAAGGGGMFIDGGNVEMSKGAVKSNSATGSGPFNGLGAGGGGIYVSSGSLTLLNVPISRNLAAWNGGGLYESGGSVWVVGGSIAKNGVVNNGGGIYVSAGSLTLNNNVKIKSNYTATIAGATGNGGGMYVGGSAKVTMAGGSIALNTLTNNGNGGGFFVGGGSLTLYNVTINGNGPTGNPAGNGGGMYIDGGGTVIISGGSIASNSGTNGGGIYSSAGFLTLENNVSIAGNSAADNGGGLYLSSQSITTLYNKNAINCTIGAPNNMNWVLRGNGGGAYLQNGGIIKNWVSGTTVNDLNDPGGTYKTGA